MESMLKAFRDGESVLDLSPRSTVSGGVVDIYDEDRAIEDQIVTPWTFSVARHSVSGKMVFSTAVLFTGWFTTFRELISPSSDVIHMCETFLLFWQTSLFPGKVSLMDPHGNVFAVGISSSSTSPTVKLTGTSCISHFYHLTNPHMIVLKYIGSNSFHFRLFDLNVNEVRYPFFSHTLIKMSNVVFDSSFYRTIKIILDPNQLSIELGSVFHFFWYDEITDGPAYITDPEGNRHELLIVDRPIGCFRFVSGITQFFEFYSITSIHHAWLHYVGDNEFSIRLFSPSGSEKIYPIILDRPLSPISPNSPSPQSQSDVSWYHQLSPSDIVSEKPLKIPPKFVRRFSLQHRFHIMMYDNRGKNYKCSLSGGFKDPDERYIVEGWLQFLKQFSVNSTTYLMLSFSDCRTLNVLIT